MKPLQLQVAVVLCSEIQSAIGTELKQRLLFWLWAQSYLSWARPLPSSTQTCCSAPTTNCHQKFLCKLHIPAWVWAYYWEGIQTSVNKVPYSPTTIKTLTVFCFPHWKGWTFAPHCGLCKIVCIFFKGTLHRDCLAWLLATCSQVSLLSVTDAIKKAASFKRLPTEF